MSSISAPKVVETVDKNNQKLAGDVKNMNISNGHHNNHCKDSKTPSEMNPWPQYIEDRLKLWDYYVKRHKEEILAKTPQPIEIKLPDGKLMAGESWRTSPYDIAKSISQSLADQAVISKVNGELWDLERPLENSCALQILKFDDDEAKQVYWHSTAHVLGEGMERFYGGCLCYGPPIQDGFYYDMFLENNRTVVNEDLKKLEDIMKLAIKDRQNFERLELTKEELLDMFKYNPFKVRILNEKVDTPKTTVYRCGPLIDLCRGPHVRNTGKIKAFNLIKTSSAFWEGKSDAESLQRIYGISFPDTKQLKEWQKFQEEAAARDHRKIGLQQELFSWHELSPGSTFFFPRGTLIYNKLTDLMRKEYRKRGFTEVISPNMYNTKLWQTSGHMQHYSSNMFKFEVENEQFALKPMNCPGHCLMFDTKRRTHKELPIRFADFGVLHRNEMSGALTGLTRVRRFQQDDAHIFCRPDQIGAEIESCLDFLRFTYDIFGFDFKLFLSTRPDDFMGDRAVWDDAEGQLKKALDGFGRPWKENPGDGAFYGPKIDILIMDAMRRPHQCGTIQLDFNLPQRFNLTFTDESGSHHRPVMIHRAILGSVERMMAVLTENYGGKWPFWLSPRQVMVIPVHPAMEEYATKVRQTIYDAEFECDMDLDTSDTMNKKIRNAQLAQYNFILVVGEKEAANGTVNVRTRDNKVHGEMGLDEVISKFQRLRATYAKNSEEWQD
uniref:threonine--tRNA ligase n=1 Tax=Romanomermis culicivorax TaxID=13658 RepID=A0A915JPZ2_ROMCU